MALFTCTLPRPRRGAALLFCVAVLSLYLPLALLRLARSSSNDVGRGQVRIEREVPDVVKDAEVRSSLEHHKDPATPKLGSGAAVRLKDIVPAGDGSLNLILNIDVQDLLDNVNMEYLQHKIQTPYRPPSLPGLPTTPSATLCGPGTRILFYVFSLPESHQRRRSIRKTWGNKHLFTDRSTSLMFVIGQGKDAEARENVMAEADRHEDILLLDVPDNLYNTTLKGVSALYWVSIHCPQALWVIKAEDYTFVNIFRLNTILSSQASSPTLMCLLWGERSMPIQRGGSSQAECSQWCVDGREFPDQTHFPQYCAGFAYIMSQSLISPLYHASQRVAFFRFDDVYVTTLLLSTLKQVHKTPLNEKYSFNPQESIEQYTHRDQSITHYFIRVTDPEHYTVLFTHALDRLTEAERKGVEQSVIDTYLAHR